MGFSLIGNSGDQSSTSNIFETTYTSDLNPQFDLEGSGAGAAAIDLTPVVQGGGLSSYAPLAFDAYAPVNVVSTGDEYGDQALSTLAQVSGQQTAASEASGTASSTTTLSSLLSGDTIYYVLGAIVLLFLSNHK